MENSHDAPTGNGNPQGINRRTFLETTAGLFAAYSATARQSLGSESLPTAGAAGIREIETAICTLRLD